MTTPIIKTKIQPKEKRIKNINEVDLGYAKKTAAEEAARCPQCSDPTCMQGCILKIDIPGFIRHLRENDSVGALDIIDQNNTLPAVCGRICPAPCQQMCVLADDEAAINIRALERFARDNGLARTIVKKKIEPEGKKVAVVGSGALGLTAANVLASRNYQVTIFEALDKIGGSLVYGIPEFRLPEKVLADEISRLESLGVKFKTNVLVGATVPFEELVKEGFEAVLLAVGAGMPKVPQWPGVFLKGVHFADEILMKMNLTGWRTITKGDLLSFLGEKVVVVGASNMGLDCARLCRRLGKDVTIVYDKTEEEMDVPFQEREFGKEEGVKYELMSQPFKFIEGNESTVRGVECIRMDFADPLNTGKWQLVPVAGSEFIFECDSVIVAMGHTPNSVLRRIFPQVIIDNCGRVMVNPLTGMTAKKGIFAAGSVVTGHASILDSIRAGFEICEKIDSFLMP